MGATYHCLDERDIFVVFDKPTVQKAVDLFRRVSPSLVFTHAAKDYMMDHEVVSMLARAASFAYGIPNVSSLPRPADAVVPHLYYCDPIGGVDPYGARSSRRRSWTSRGSTNKSRRCSRATPASGAHHGMDEYLDAMRRHAGERGRQAGTTYAEAFVQHRGHSYPADDLLAAMFKA
jgi:LmbE family N-acetylglucosaminyl deacetylase